LRSFAPSPEFGGELVPRAVKVSLKIASCAALLLLFLWPAIYNGQPLFSPDTSAYIRGFDAGVVWLSGRTSPWTTWASRLDDRQEEPDDAAVSLQSPKDAKVSLQSSKFIIAGRSTSYGALLYLGEVLGGLWASVAIQAAAALIALGLTLKHLKLFSWPKFIFTAGTLGLLSSLPFVASFLLPDVFAGLSILAAANLLVLGDRLMRWEWVFWVSILGTAVVFHPTHLAIVMMLLAVAVIARLLTKKISVVGVMTLAFAAGIGFASEIGFDLVVEKLLGVRVSRPPVILARVIADGPGAAYLREKCPQAGLVVCEFVDRLMPNPDLFLWNTTDSKGVYESASIDKRQELGNEQYRFAAAVLAYDPFGQITAGLSNAFQQLTTFGLSDFVASADLATNVPRVHAERMARSLIWKKDFPIAIFSAVTMFAAAVSLIFAGITLIVHWKSVSAEIKIFCFVILLGQISNALICGTLSGPHERYQARLTWLLPVAALLLPYDRRVRSAERRSAVYNVTDWALAGYRTSRGFEDSLRKAGLP
jgi:hypothetical protein